MESTLISILAMKRKKKGPEIRIFIYFKLCLLKNQLIGINTRVTVPCTVLHTMAEYSRCIISFCQVDLEKYKIDQATKLGTTLFSSVSVAFTGSEKLAAVEDIRSADTAFCCVLEVLSYERSVSILRRPVRSCTSFSGTPPSNI